MRRATLIVFAILLLAPSPAEANHPDPPQNPFQYVNVPWTKSWDYGNTFTRWDEDPSTDDTFDLKMVLDELYPLPTSAWNSRLSDVRAHFNTDVYPIRYAVKLWTPVVRPIAGQDAWKPNCPVGFPVAGDPSSWRTSAFVGIGYRRLNNPMFSGAAYTCIKNTANGWQRWEYIALNSEIAWHTGTGSSWPTNQSDAWSILTHELGHAIGFGGIDTGNGVTVGGGDDTKGHFSNDPLYRTCDPAFPESYQTMCATQVIPIGQLQAVDVNQRTLGSHDLSAIKDGYTLPCTSLDFSCSIQP